MAEKKKTTKTKSTESATPKTATLPLKEKKEEKKEEPVYSYAELATIFGISVMKAKAYFNMCQLDYSQKITVKKARELFNKF